ncbi:MAG: iron-containing alcohol dehydrogenase, partial [Clostridia bacterium]|nr:iron-containing alcohol dehydrogenase [Clostridia bacterium]
PDEHACGALAMAFDPACDAIVAVGSGVIGDACKVLSHTAGRPQMTGATPPAMDGFASSNASMIQTGVKVPLYPGCPAAILCDIDIIKNAPMHMLHAGLGDMLAKYVSIFEWRVANLVVGEYYCDNVAALVRRSLRRCVSKADGLVRRDPDAVSAVVEGLVLSGVAMTFAQISRPASGLEHYFSHLWEMFALLRGEPSELHGIQVGVGTLLTLDILEKLGTTVPDRARAEQAMNAFSEAAWEARMRGIFGPVAETVIEAEKTVYHKNDPMAHAVRLGKIIDNWPRILSILREEIPVVSEINTLMRRIGMPMTPADIGVLDPDVRRALLGSREIRDKYLTSSLLWDLGLLDAFADG